MNRDGAYSRGASLPELKGRRNAAGNFPARWEAWPCRALLRAVCCVLDNVVDFQVS